jgi:D-glycero-alpha-D-manno-heptose-7-phosphate kinase
VGRAMGVLASDQELGAFGELLHQAWLLKRQFSDAVSNSLVDQAYDSARAAGAVGGKLLGAGGGGFLLIYCEPDRQVEVRAALAAMREVSFRFENHGSRLIFYKP